MLLTNFFSKKPVSPVARLSAGVMRGAGGGWGELSRGGEGVLRGRRGPTESNWPGPL